MGVGLMISLMLLAMLVVILVTLLMDERHLRATKAPDGRLTGIWDGSERRASVRIDAQLKAKYAVDTTPQEKKDTTTKNISLVGILMESYEKLYPSTLLLLDIFLMDQKYPLM